MDMHKVWLWFCQTVTISLAAMFVLTVLRPDILAIPAKRRLPIVPENPAPSNIETAASGYSRAAQLAAPAVVNIFTNKKVRLAPHSLLNDPLLQRFFGDKFDPDTERASSLGSGVIVSADGLIITNHHVVEAADEIEVALVDGRHSTATLVGSDPDTDLAILRIAPNDLPALALPEREALRVGDVVLAIGNPFGVGQTVTMGIVSALGRNHLGLSTYENFIQTDAAINPGNSGGALIDAYGRLVGINTAIYSRSGGSMGIGFAIPAKLAREVMEQIMSTGAVTRGWIGVEVQELTPELAESFKLKGTSGTLIAGVLKEGPAERAGIRPGDILVSIQGQKISDPSRMLNIVAGLTPGMLARLTVFRDGKSIEFSVLVGQRPSLSNQ